MRKIFLTAIVAMFAMCVSAQNCGKTSCSSATCSKDAVYTNVCNDKKLIKKAEKWMKKGEWRHGFTKASPHASVNAVDFYNQYQKDPVPWSKMFEFLQKTDLMALPKGSVEIPGTKLKLSVQDDANGPLEKRGTESHYHHIDFQWCVKGVERFGVIDHNSSPANCEYNAKKDVIHYNYDKSKTHFYDSTPDKFFIFFPGDWHIAKVNNDTNDQNIRVLVVKLEWVE